MALNSARLRQRVTVLESRVARLEAALATPATSQPRCMQIIAQFYGITTDDLLGRCRRWEYAWPRFVCWELLHTAGWSTVRIAEQFGRDHGTIGHGLRVVRDRCSVTPELQSVLDGLLKEAA
jgi:chromosomal replication initiation ATPase DnaA